MKSLKHGLSGVRYLMIVRALLLIVLFTLGPSSAFCTEIEEDRDIVFEYETGKAMAEFVREYFLAAFVVGCKKSVTVVEAAAAVLFGIGKDDDMIVRNFACDVTHCFIVEDGSVCA